MLFHKSEIQREKTKFGVSFEMSTGICSFFENNLSFVRGKKAQAAEKFQITHDTPELLRGKKRTKPAYDLEALNLCFNYSRTSVTPRNPWNNR